MRIRSRVAHVLTAGLAAFALGQMVERAAARQGTLFVDQALIDGWAGIRVLGLDDGSCPAGWTEDTDLRGRYLVGTPSGGTNAGTRGTPLTNLQERRGGTAHTHGFTTPTLSYSDPTGSVTNPTVSQTPYNVSYTRPSISYTPPSTITVTNPPHTHAYRQADFSFQSTNVRLVGGLPRAVFNTSNAASAQTSGSATQNTSISLTGGVSLTGGSASVTGGTVSLSGGGVTFSGGSVTVSGGGIANGGGEPIPAPYIQVPICAYDPI